MIPKTSSRWNFGDLIEARQLLPICTRCGKIKEGEHDWSSVETCFKRNGGSAFEKQV